MKKPIKKVSVLRAQMPEILERINKDQKLAKAALVNPIMALEDMDYALDEEFKLELEYHIRFGDKDKKKLMNLRKSIFREAGEEFNLSSKTSLVNVLKPLVAQQSSKKAKDKSYAAKITSKRLAELVQPLQNTGDYLTKEKDPLEEISELHPLIPLLVEFRKLEASAPRLGTAKAYKHAYDNKDVSVDIRNVTFEFTQDA